MSEDNHPTIVPRLLLLEERNRRVEKDKAWETSLTRRLLVALITYAFAVILLKFVIQAPNAWLGALVPVAGYVLSTLGLFPVRKIWEKTIYNRRDT